MAFTQELSNPVEEDNDQIAKLACTVCKRRKQRCDRVRPSCGTCARLSHECLYVDERIGDERRPRKRNKPVNGHAPSLISESSSQQASPIGFEDMNKPSVTATSSTSLSPTDLASSISLPVMPIYPDDSIAMHLLDPNEFGVEDSARPLPTLGMSTMVDYNSPAMQFYAAHVYPFLQIAAPGSQRLETSSLLHNAAQVFTHHELYTPVRLELNLALENQPTLTVLQANILLSVYEYMCCRIVAFQLRTAASMRLCKLFQIIPLKRDRCEEYMAKNTILRRPMTISESEERTRTYWAALSLCRLADPRETELVVQQSFDGLFVPRPPTGLPDLSKQMQAWTMIRDCQLAAMSLELSETVAIDPLRARLDEEIAASMDVEAKLLLLGAGIILLDRLCCHLYLDKHTMKNPAAVMAGYARQVSEIASDNSVGFLTLWVVYEACNQVAWQWAEFKDPSHFETMNGLRGTLERYVMPVGPQLARMADIYFARLVSE